jgi:hypothetical protein
MTTSARPETHLPDLATRFRQPLPAKARQYVLLKVPVYINPLCDCGRY